ncbi:zinc ribbon domain-containing protein [Leptolyngbya sp. FACHB-261]|uniref:zinc ribbon domain-containing protein n=1 Tax=Leptolyngbya sp. FACHB-261 TaxID=2692806 RepID=UPI0037BF874E
MANSLKSCPDCGHMVSPKAASCPNCGRKLTSILNDSLRVAVILVLVVVILSAGYSVLQVWWIASQDRGGEIGEQARQAQQSLEDLEKAVEEARSSSENDLASATETNAGAYSPPTLEKSNPGTSSSSSLTDQDLSLN